MLILYNNNDCNMIINADKQMTKCLPTQQHSKYFVIVTK